MSDARAPHSGWPLVFWYSFFALIATAINMGTQWLVMTIYRGSFMLIAAMAFGTSAGLVTKYILDKKWIFQDNSSGLANHAKKFSLYSAAGVITTAVFWGFEAIFYIMLGEHYALIGGCVGLAVGYVTKYHLDRHFVFGATA